MTLLSSRDVCHPGKETFLRADGTAAAGVVIGRGGGGAGAVIFSALAANYDLRSHQINANYQHHQPPPRHSLGAVGTQKTRVTTINHSPSVHTNT